MTIAPRAMSSPRRPMPRRMADLLSLHTPRPHRDDDEHEQVVELLDQLMRQARPTRDQQDYAGVLALLVQSYEKEHHTIADAEVTGSDLLRLVMKESGTTAKQIADLLGVGPPLVSMILAGKRSLTWHHARTLAAHFAMQPTAFMG